VKFFIERLKSSVFPVGNLSIENMRLTAEEWPMVRKRPRNIIRPESDSQRTIGDLLLLTAFIYIGWGDFYFFLL
jgi:hypothetical protein